MGRKKKFDFKMGGDEKFGEDCNSVGIRIGGVALGVGEEKILKWDICLIFIPFFFFFF